MKKLIILIAGVFLIACNEDPNNIVINSKEDIDRKVEAIKQLPEEDRSYLARYIVRREFAQQFKIEPPPYGITVREMIDKQKSFEDKNKKKLKEDKKNENSLKEQKALEVERFNEKYPLSIIDSKVVTNIIGEKELIFSIVLKNNSDKDIKALDKILEYSILGTDLRKRVHYLGTQVLDKPLMPDEETVFKASIDLNDIFALKAEIKKNGIEVKFIEAEILFTDGESEKLPVK
ncbi:hypothetical protein ACFGZ0_04555 [Pasteurella multocida]